MAIAEDGSTPAVATGSGTGTLTTASFTPPQYALLLAVVSGGRSSTTLTAAITDSGLHTWQTIGQFSGATGDGGGLAAAYYTYLPAAPGASTVTATYTGFGTGGGRTLALRVLTGACPDQTGAGQGHWFYGGAGDTNGITSFASTQTGSVGYGISNQPNASNAPTGTGGTTLVNDFTSTEPSRMFLNKLTSPTSSIGGNFFLCCTYSVATVSIALAIEITPSVTPRPLRFSRQAVKRASFY